MSWLQHGDDLAGDDTPLGPPLHRADQGATRDLLVKTNNSTRGLQTPCRTVVMTAASSSSCRQISAAPRRQDRKLIQRPHSAPRNTEPNHPHAACAHSTAPDGNRYSEHAVIGARRTTFAREGVWAIASHSHKPMQHRSH